MFIEQKKVNFVIIKTTKMKTDLVEIFQTIRAEMQPYSSMGFTVRENSDVAYDLWSEKKVTIENKKKNELYFAGVILKEDHVSFRMAYYEEADFHPSLLKLLKDKSYFHIKELDDTLLHQISEALVAGFTLYKQNEWI